MLDDLKPGDLILVRDDACSAWRVAWLRRNDEEHVVAEPWDTCKSMPKHWRYWRPLPVPTASELIRQTDARYMLSVDGARAPSHIHDSLESAEREAERLIRKRNAPVVRILRLEKTLRRKITIEEE